MDGYLPLLGVYLPPHVLTTLLVIATIILTGGLHCDGFMDTMDGIFSGRSRERMLEIMKDSRVGANGVVAFMLYLLLKWSLLIDVSPVILPTALFVMPVVARLAMVIGITTFPYARPEGIGKAFAQYADSRTLLIAAVFTLLLIVPLGKQAIICSIVGILFAMVFARYVTKLLGGLTGDVYGAITDLTELVVLLVYLF
jgi:adenosylcobinamide-GDP ribazoletransferase